MIWLLIGLIFIGAFITVYGMYEEKTYQKRLYAFEERLRKRNQFMRDIQVDKE